MTNPSKARATTISGFWIKRSLDYIISNFFELRAIGQNKPTVGGSVTILMPCFTILVGRILVGWEVIKIRNC